MKTRELFQVLYHLLAFIVIKFLCSLILTSLFFFLSETKNSR